MLAFFVPALHADSAVVSCDYVTFIAMNFVSHQYVALLAVLQLLVAHVAGQAVLALIKRLLVKLVPSLPTLAMKTRFALSAYQWIADPGEAHATGQALHTAPEPLFTDSNVVFAGCFGEATIVAVDSTEEAFYSWQVSQDVVTVEASQR